MSDTNNTPPKADVADVDALAAALLPLVPILATFRELLAGFKQLALAQLQSGPSIVGPAWKQIHDTCSIALGEQPSGSSQPVHGKPAMTVPRFANPPPPARAGAAAAWPGQATDTPSGPAPIATVPIGDIRKRDDVARELSRVTQTLHPGAVAPTTTKDS